MPLNREWQTRIKAVEREFAAVALAVARLLQEGQKDPTVHTGGVERRDVLNASRNLEGTYIVRLFAEFETGLRQYWETISDTHPKMEGLLNGLAARRKIGNEQLGAAHAVRKYRNSLVHEREDEEIEPIPIAVARGYLCRFFSFLPNEW